GHLDLADLDAGDLLGRTRLLRALAVRVRAGDFQLHRAGLGRLGTLASLDHAVLHAAGQGLHAGLGLVLGQELVRAGLVLGGDLVVLRLGFLGAGLLALLEGFQRRTQLVGGDRRLLLGQRILDALDYGIHIELLATGDRKSIV